MLHLKSGSPRPWELVPGIGHHEVLIRETNPAPIPDAALLTHQAPNLHDVLQIRVRGGEGIALLHAVALGNIEDVQQQLLVVHLHAGP